MITVIIITKNEQERIEACLESVKWADEVMVVDNMSTDDTVKIAKKYTNNIVSEHFNDFASQRKAGMEKAKGDWVFYVDADERVLDPLKKEVLDLVNLPSNFSAFAVSRRNIIFGQEKRYGPFWPDWVIRIFKKSDFETWVGEVHEYGKFKGELGYTKNSLYHLTHRNLDQVVLKSLDWSRIDAKLRLDAKHPRMSSWRLLRILFSELWFQGITRKGFFAGTVGTIDAILQTFSLVITYIRLWEMQKEKPLADIYDEIDRRLIQNNFQG